jgi:spermidine synthase
VPPAPTRSAASDDGRPSGLVPDRLAALVPSRIETAVFVSGVVSMGLEIVAGRQLAPTFGSSVYTWGSIIGVFLAALALGYWIAGRRAARRASRNALAVAFVGTGAFVALVVFGGELLLAAAGDLPLPARFAPLVPVTILFGPPTVLLGFVSPYAAELVDAESTGDASGRVYALGTAGSIVGAFGTTFLLVPAFGVVAMEFGFGVLVVATALLLATPEAKATWTGTTLVAIGLVVAFTAAGGVVPGVGGDVVYETQTQYQHLQVVDQGDTRTLYLDDTPHSAMYLDSNRYVFEYSRYLHLPMLAVDDPEEVDRVLFIGGGGFSSPKRYAEEYNATVDVVEIDPEVVRVATEYFGVDESEMTIHTMDGREYLEQTNRSYDVVVLDAYRADRVPYHLTTTEFMRLVSDRMDDDGVVVANVISGRDGPESAFYRAQYRTMDFVFPQTYSFPTEDRSGVQNIELVASKDSRRLSQAEFRERNRQRAVGLNLSDELDQYQGDVDTSDAPLLTDDYAPVDSLLARQVDQQYAPDRTNASAAG